MDAHSPEESFRRSILRAAGRALGIEPQSIPLTYPPTAELGDIASPVCFELARQARRPPRELAVAIVEAFEPDGGIERVEVAGGGYINAFLDRRAFLCRRLGGLTTRRGAADGPKIIVEHTNINPNKAAHIGHLRNAVLGDTLVRCLRHMGRAVEVQNYIDDTGVQVADLVVGFRVLRNEGLAEVERRYAEDELRRRGERFDFVAWDLYAEVTRFYGDESNLAHRQETLKAMEQGDNPIARLAAHVARRMVQHHLITMDRIGVRYDLLPHESDILGLHFWDHAFERLRDSGAIHKAESGKNAACWVMDLAGVEEGAGEDQKVIVRSDGTVTYVGKDIAYQMWKFGLLGRDFNYEPFDWSPQREAYSVWSTCSTPGTPGAPRFGQAAVVYNVIDTRQSYLQRVVAQALLTLGHAAQAERSIHYAYEMVALTPAAVSAMFPDHPLSEEDRKRTYLEMSGRRGLGVRADDLQDTLFARAAGEIHKRNPQLDEISINEVAEKIAVGALRYYMLRFSRNRVVAFDLDDALAFEGETGPYLQYSVVRARNILAKVAERHGADEVEPDALVARLDLAALEPGSDAEHWNLALQMIRVEAVVRQAVESLELSAVAKHAYVVAQAFNSFYHRFRVAGEEDPVVRATRSAFVRVYHDGMVELLELMGISVPDRM